MQYCQNKLRECSEFFRWIAYFVSASFYFLELSTNYSLEYEVHSVLYKYTKRRRTSSLLCFGACRQITKKLDFTTSKTEMWQERVIKIFFDTMPFEGFPGDRNFSRMVLPSVSCYSASLFSQKTLKLVDGESRSDFVAPRSQDLRLERYVCGDIWKIWSTLAFNQDTIKELKHKIMQHASNIDNGT